ncbi:MAG: zinc ribbon domain-containing protein [Lachnospiraceae bacterium]|nr:zinc ribbon domain-containing protein [Lachnospiraceae bacterium]
MKCGQELPDGAMFCFKCGTPIGTLMGSMSNDTTKLVPAKCTGCGAPLKVNPEEKTAKCEHCGNEFIVQEAINNYNISTTGNVNISGSNITIKSGPDVESYLYRANEFFNEFNFDKANEYYEKVLDLDPMNSEAKRKIEDLSFPMLHCGTLKYSLLEISFTERKTKKLLESGRIDHPESRRIDQFQSFRNRQCSGRLLSLRF